MNLSAALGFSWNRDSVPTDIPTQSRKRVCFRVHKMRPQFVWNTCAIQGIPFTFAEVQTVMDGVTMGGRRIPDHESVL